MKKILHINLERGWRGGERQTLLLAKGLMAAGWESEILARENTALVGKAGAAGLNVTEASKPYLKYSNFLRRFDLIHAHEVRGFQMAALSKWWHRKPLIYTRRLAKPPSQSLFTHIKYALADKIVAESKAVRRSINSVLHNCTADVIHGAVDQENAIDHEKVHTIANRFSGRAVVGCVAAMTHEKGHKFLLECVERIQAADEKVVFVLLGDGPLRSELEALAEARNLGNVVFEGFVENVQDYMEVFDLLVIPSRSEAFVSVALDAFVSGVPVVATNVGGNPEAVIPGVTGELVEYGDVTGMVRVISMLLNSPTVLASLAASAKLKAKKEYSVGRMVAEYADLYRQLLVVQADIEG